MVVPPLLFDEVVVFLAVCSVDILSPAARPFTIFTYSSAVFKSPEVSSKVSVLVPLLFLDLSSVTKLIIEF